MDKYSVDDFENVEQLQNLLDEKNEELSSLRSEVRSLKKLKDEVQKKEDLAKQKEEEALVLEQIKKQDGMYDQLLERARKECEQNSEDVPEENRIEISEDDFDDTPEEDQGEQSYENPDENAQENQWG